MSAPLTRPASPAIGVGDRVTWRSAKHPGALGITGCEVVALGKTEDEEDAAKLIVFGEHVNALVSDLTVEPSP